MKLAIGLPIVDSIPGECFGHHVATIVEAVKLPGVEVVSITPVGLCPHDYAREEIAKEAIERGCDRLFFIDADTISPRGGITTLMETMDIRKCAVVSGFYLRRGDPYTSVWSKELDGNWFNVDAAHGVHEIDVSGCGCCLIDLKWMVQNVPTPWFRMKQNPTHTVISDDVVMFEAVKRAGGLILGNADVSCVHIGRHEYISRETADGLRKVHVTLEAANLLVKHSGEQKKES